MASAPNFTASRTTSQVMSRANRTFVTGAFPSPASSPELSPLCRFFSGASLSISIIKSFTLNISFLPILLKISAARAALAVQPEALPSRKRFSARRSAYVRADGSLRSSFPSIRKSSAGTNGFAPFFTAFITV